MQSLSGNPHEITATDGPEVTSQPGTSLAVVHPLTGESIDLHVAGDDQIAQFLVEIAEHQNALRDLKRIVGQEALYRLDRQASWTMHTAGYTLKAPSPQPVEEFDELALRSDLLELVEQGELAITAVDAAIETVVTYKARKAGINALRKLGGRVAEIVDRHARNVDKQRYVSVTQKGRIE